MERKAIELVPMNKIEVRSNVRERLVESEQVTLAGSIKQNGICVPCIGYEDGPIVVPVDGHRRIDAAKRVGLDAVPMILVDHAPCAVEILILQFVVNCHRSGLKPTERARAIERLMQESGWPAAQVSAKLGEQSESMISKLLTLLVHPKEVQNLIDSGQIPISSAYAIATVADADERQRLVAAVLDGSLKRDDLVKRIKSLKRNRQQPQRARQAKHPSRERVTVPLGTGRTITVVGPGLCVETLIAWLEDLVNRIRTVNVAGVGLKDLAKLLKPLHSVERKSD